MQVKKEIIYFLIFIICSCTSQKFIESSTYNRKHVSVKIKNYDFNLVTKNQENNFMFELYTYDGIKIFYGYLTKDSMKLTNATPYKIDYKFIDLTLLQKFLYDYLNSYLYKKDNFIYLNYNENTNTYYICEKLNCLYVNFKNSKRKNECILFYNNHEVSLKIIK